MALIYGYAVKYNGKYYPPNTPIPEKKIEPQVETKPAARSKRVKGDTK